MCTGPARGAFGLAGGTGNCGAGSAGGNRFGAMGPLAIWAFGAVSGGGARGTPEAFSVGVGAETIVGAGATVDALPGVGTVVVVVLVVEATAVVGALIGAGVVIGVVVGATGVVGEGVAAGVAGLVPVEDAASLVGVDESVVVGAVDAVVVAAPVSGAVDAVGVLLSPGLVPEVELSAMVEPSLWFLSTRVMSESVLPPLIR